MKLPAIGLLLASLVIATVSPLAARAQGDPAVAVQQAVVDDPGHAPIPIAIWSPKLQAGQAAPLIVISHGTGAALSSHIDTARALAGAGFVVVAPLHPGDNFQDDSAVGKPQWMADRSRHVSKVIDYMFAGWEGRAHLIPNRVGIFGFSAGGTTALIAVGGIPDLNLVAGHCAKQPEFACKLMVPAASDALPPQWTHDQRIAAAVVAAPGLGFTFDPASLRNVKVPVQLWAGTADQIVPYDTNTAVVRRLLGPSVDFHSVEGAGHLSFLAPCPPDGPPMLCQDGPGFDRVAFHHMLNETMIAFFRQHLGAKG